MLTKYQSVKWNGNFVLEMADVFFRQQLRFVKNEHIKNSV